MSDDKALDEGVNSSADNQRKYAALRLGEDAYRMFVLLAHGDSWDALPEALRMELAEHAKSFLIENAREAGISQAPPEVWELYLDGDYEEHATRGYFATLEALKRHCRAHSIDLNDVYSYEKHEVIE